MATTRRSLLVGSAALALAGARDAQAIGAGSLVGTGQLQHAGTWDPRPEALRRLLWETGRRTSIDTARDATALGAGQEGLFRHPLLVLTGQGALPAFAERERRALAKHLRMGGLLWVDGDGADRAFFDGVEQELAQIFPKDPMRVLPREHVLQKSFYLLDGAAGRTVDDTRVMGIEAQSRALVFVTRCDVLGALERDRIGTWRFECTPDGERQREKAIRFAVNLVMYATCLDYKEDQVHIPFIMKKKRR